MGGCDDGSSAEGARCAKEVLGACFDSKRKDSSPPQAGQEIVSRMVSLHVDSDKGAGLDLEPVDYGYRVIELGAEGPAQDLCVGDVICDIAGEPLWGLSEDDLEATFGDRFADGATLRVVALEAICDATLQQPVVCSSDPGADVLRGFRDDLQILAGRYGVSATAMAEESGGAGNCIAVSLRSRPDTLRRAVWELRELAAFYFQDCGLQVPLPPCRWIVPSDEERAAAAQALSSWEATMRQQVQELDEDMEHGPSEPLEAPDEGPDVFEGEAIARGFHMVRPLRILLLVGLPGSGKSTLASKLGEQGWVVVNQDTLGSRPACEAAASKALDAGRRVVIDRCNVSISQRLVWLTLADAFSVCAGCLWVDVHPEECGQRVLRRFAHPTLAAEPASLQVIAAFAERFEAPDEAEGFVLWRGRTADELEPALHDVHDVADETDHWGAHRGAQRQQQQQQAPNKKQAGGGFRYKKVPIEGKHQRTSRPLFLRQVRRQIQYYFTDQNLRQDWFFQEKIRDEPESGWLALRWILSCPRIRDVYKATDHDVIQALGPSHLLMKIADGERYVRRGKPLPPLAEPRPQKGEEPDWYKALHQSVGEEQGCDHGCGQGDEHHSCHQCQRRLPAAQFSNSQLRKKKKLCKDCVDGVPIEEERSSTIALPQERADAGTAGERFDSPETASTTTPAAVSAAQPPVRCKACARELPRENFTKAQLTKHRQNPTCRRCVEAACA